MTQASRPFMNSWKYPLLFGFSRTLVVLILVIFVRWLSGSLRDWTDARTFAVALLGLFVFLSLLAKLITWFYGAEATPQSLRIRFWSGRYVEVPWQRIEAVHPVSLLGACGIQVPNGRHSYLSGWQRIRSSAMRFVLTPVTAISWQSGSFSIPTPVDFDFCKTTQ